MAVTANNPVKTPTAPANGASVTTGKRVRKAAPENETKAAKWKRLVNFRGAKAVKLLRQIGNLSSRISYEYDDADAGKLISAMEREVASMKQRFTTKAQADAPASIV